MSTLGSALGSRFGPLGSAVGGVAGSMLSRITGFGSYKVSKNTIAEGTAIPSFYNNGDGTRVCHREYLGDIMGSVNFKIGTYAINPGVSATFPWLSTIASGFEMYEFNGLVFEYRPASGAIGNSTSASLGVVVYATDYDVFNPVWNSKQQMDSYEYASSTVPFEGMMHCVECAPDQQLHKKWLVRTADVPDAELPMSDLGKFSYATQGMQASYAVGELWVSYDVTFTKPRIDPEGFVHYAHFRETPVGSATNTAFFGTATYPLTSIDSTRAVAFAKSTNLITLPTPGTYCVMASCYCPGIIITSGPAISFGSNISSNDRCLIDDGVLSGLMAASNNGGIIFGFLHVNTSGTGTENNVLFTPAAFTGNAGYRTDVFVFKLPNTPEGQFATIAP